MGPPFALAMQLTFAMPPTAGGNITILYDGGPSGFLTFCKVVSGGAGREAGADRRRIRLRYLNVIMSVRLSVEAFAFNGSLVRFALPEFNML